MSSKSVSVLESYIATCERVGSASLATNRVRWLLRMARNGEFIISAENVRKVGELDMGSARVAELAGDQATAGDCYRMAQAMRAVASLLA